MADASLPDMRARSRPGTAIAAMMPIIGHDDQQLDEGEALVLLNLLHE